MYISAAIEAGPNGGLARAFSATIRPDEDTTTVAVTVMLCSESGKI